MGMDIKFYFKSNGFQFFAFKLKEELIKLSVDRAIKVTLMINYSSIYCKIEVEINKSHCYKKTISTPNHLFMQTIFSKVYI